MDKLTKSLRRPIAFSEPLLGKRKPYYHDYSRSKHHKSNHKDYRNDRAYGRRGDRYDRGYNDRPSYDDREHNREHNREYDRGYDRGYDRNDRNHRNHRNDRGYGDRYNKYDDRKYWEKYPNRYWWKYN